MRAGGDGAAGVAGAAGVEGLRLAVQAERERARDHELPDAGGTGEDEGVRETLRFPAAAQEAIARSWPRTSAKRAGDAVAGAVSAGGVAVGAPRSGARRRRGEAVRGEPASVTRATSALTRREVAARRRCGGCASGAAAAWSRKPWRTRCVKVAIEHLIAIGLAMPALGAELDRTIEQQRQVGVEPAASSRRPSAARARDRAAVRSPDTRSSSPRSDRRATIGAGGERRLDHGRDVLGAVGEEEQELGVRRERELAAEHHAAELAAERGRARLARADDAMTARGEEGGEARRPACSCRRRRCPRP